MTVDRAHRDAAELAAELRRDRGYGEEAARIVIALVSALKAAEKERDGLQAWYDKVAPTTVPTVREAVAEKRAKAAEERARRIADITRKHSCADYEAVSDEGDWDCALCAAINHPAAAEATA